MTEAELLDIARETALVLMKVGAPVLLGGLAVGLFISVLQALTQVMEPTLTFVPKALATILILMMLTPYIMNELKEFLHHMMDLVVAGY